MGKKLFVHENYKLGTKPSMKGLGIGFALSCFGQITGVFTILTYAVMIFEKAKTSIDPHICSIILAIALISGSLTTTYLADKLGRKVLNFISMLGSGIGLLSLSLYHYLYAEGYNLSAFEWVPVVSLSFVIFISASGVLPLTIICTVENLPPKVYLMSYFFEYSHH